RQATWAEIDFEKRLWIIPASHTKRRREQRDHVVPLSRQATAILETQKMRSFTSKEALIFPSDIKGAQLPKTLLLNAVKTLRATLPEDQRPPETTVHGFRATASTLLNGMGFPRDVIERQLSHKERDKVRNAYNRFEYIEERTAMMQTYADYLDKLKRTKS
ncbi:site-specific integrase, partial [Pyramidobacter sp.]